MALCLDEGPLTLKSIREIMEGMANEALHSAVDEMSPQIKELAENLGQSPEGFLRVVVERERRKQVALSKLDQVVSEAEASGFHQIDDFDEDLEELKTEARQRFDVK